MKKQILIASKNIIIIILFFVSLASNAYATALNVGYGQSVYLTSNQTYSSVYVDAYGYLSISNSATITVSGNADIYGKISIDGAATLTMSGDLNTYQGSGYNGKFALGSATINMNSGNMNIGGQYLALLNNNATINFNNTVASNSLKCTGSTLQILNGILTVNGNSAYYDDIIMNDGSQIYINGSGSELIFHGSDIYILAGANMYVQNGAYVYMGDYSALNIESNYLPGLSTATPGGRLYVLNSSITGGTWYGISVAGGSGGSSSSIGTSNYFSQMPIISPLSGEANVAQAIFDHSTISNSVDGICNFDAFGKGGGGYWGNGGAFYDDLGKISGGGIIQANNCTFSNNNITFEFEPYQNFASYPFIPWTPANPIGDYSFIANSYFVVNTSGLYTSITNFVQAKGVEGVQFLGCTYSDYDLILAYPAFSIKDAGITIDQACNDPYAISASTPCPPVNIGASTFLTTSGAVSATALTSQVHKLGIYNTTFTDMHVQGVVLNNLAYAQIMHNSFTLDPDQGYDGEAISLQGCTGYRIEDNTIDVYASGANPNRGIIVNSSSGNPNYIYRNTINSMDYAMQANGLNYLSSNHAIGLQLICNDMYTNSNANAFDISVNKFSGYPATTGMAIL